jgi:hypothetical protein
MCAKHAGSCQAVRDIANKLLGACRADPPVYGGFSSEVEALHPDNAIF